MFSGPTLAQVEITTQTESCTNGVELNSLTISHIEEKLRQLFSKQTQGNLNRKVHRASRKYQNQIQELNLPYIENNTHGIVFLERIPEGNGPELYGKLLSKAFLKDVELTLKQMFRKPVDSWEKIGNQNQIKTNLKISHGDLFAQIDIPTNTGNQKTTIKFNHEQFALGSRFRWGILTLRLKKSRINQNRNMIDLHGTIYIKRRHR